MNEYETIIADIKRTADSKNVSLEDQSNPYTIWLEEPMGSGRYHLLAQTYSQSSFERLAGPHMLAIVYFVKGGKIQIVKWRNSRRADEYAKAVVTS